MNSAAHLTFNYDRDTLGVRVDASGTLVVAQRTWVKATWMVIVSTAHQGEENALLFPIGAERAGGRVECRERLGGLLRYYNRPSAT